MRGENIPDKIMKPDIKKDRENDEESTVMTDLLGNLYNNKKGRASE
jgi:hypothetical protein